MKRRSPLSTGWEQAVDRGLPSGVVVILPGPPGEVHDRIGGAPSWMEDTLGSADRVLFAGEREMRALWPDALRKQGRAAAGLAKAGLRWTAKSRVGSGTARERPEVSASPAGDSTSSRQKVSEPGGSG